LIEVPPPLWHTDSMSYTIITHDGKAHMDELLASAILSIYKGENPKEILRLPSGEAAEKVVMEETAPHKYYLDCGLHFDRDRNLFDHHQDRELDSTALLILNTLFPGLEGTELHDYITLVSRIDNRGPKSLNDFDVIDESRFYFTMGQKLILKAFEEDPKSVVDLYARGIKDNMEFEKEKRAARLWLSQEENVTMERVDQLRVLHFNIRPPAELITPLRAVDDEIVDEHKIQVIYSFDDKDESARTLYRTYHGHEDLDFTRSKPDTLHFCHQSGFLMKFTPSSENEWRDIL
jgi:hypothetical protein